MTRNDNRVRHLQHCCSMSILSVKNRWTNGQDL